MQLRVRWPADGVLVILSLALAAAPAAAADEFLASAQLRGGYDANPMLLTQQRGSAFGGMDGTFAAGRGDADNGYAMVGEFSRTEYADKDVAPYEHHKLEFKAIRDLNGWSLRANTTAEVVRNYSVQAFDAVQSVRFKAPAGGVRPFVNGALQYSTLNEINPLLGDFLPDPQRFMRGSINPGVAVEIGKGAIGVSVEVSGTRYAEEPDLFGFKRNNERVEPFVFATFNDQGLDVFASVSQLYGRWHDVDFSNVSATMFEASVTKEAGPFRLSLSAQRVAQDTTFPISPLTISTRYGAEISYRLMDDLEVRGFGRGVRTAYLDTDFTTDTQALGGGVTYAIADDLTLGAEASFINGTAMDGSAFKGGIATVSLKKVIAGAAPRGGGVEPPPATATNPSWDPRPVRRHYQ